MFIHSWNCLGCCLPTVWQDHKESYELLPGNTLITHIKQLNREKDIDTNACIFQVFFCKNKSISKSTDNLIKISCLHISKYGSDQHISVLTIKKGSRVLSWIQPSMLSIVLRRHWGFMLFNFSLNWNRCPFNVTC